MILGEVELDNARTLQAIKKVLTIYAAEPADQTPMVVVLMGNLVRYAVMAGGGSGGSIEYKEYFDSLASALSDYPTMLQNTTFVFVPGDNDPGHLHSPLELLQHFQEAACQSFSLRG